MGLLESQCTFIWGENQKKKFLSSNPVEVLMLFNEEHQGLLKLQVSFCCLQERGLWSRFLLVGCCG